MKNIWLERLSPWILTLVLIILWEVIVKGFGIARIVMPSASESFYAIYEFRAGLWKSSLTTLYATVIGFGIAVVFGVLMGVAIGLWRPVYVTVYPLMVAFNAIPKVVVVPILVLWIGAGIQTSSVTAFILCFFPIVVNMAVGLATIEPELKDVLRALGAKERDIVIKVGIPRSLPYLFASLKISITLAFVGAVIAETVAGSEGIGNLMLVASSSFNTPLMFAGIIVIAAMATAMYGIFALLDTRFTGWATRGSMNFATAGG